MNKYFDNACTSYPKPKQVGEYMIKHLSEGGSYGRGGYPRIFNSSKIVEETRFEIANLIGIEHSERVVFTANSTIAINTILLGFPFKFGKIFISPLEHNAVIRSLEALRIREKIEIKVLPHFSDGLIDLEKLKAADLIGVDLIIVNHVSNVNGVIQPVKEIKRCISSIPLLVDASQSLGKVEVKVDDWDIDYLAFTGHKGLLGPTGTGGLYIKKPETIEATLFGGTGSNSDSFAMPQFMPDKFQPGTPNVTGIYGLLGALKHRPTNSWTLEKYHQLIKTFKSIDSLRAICAESIENQGDVFSVYPLNGKVSELASILFNNFGIETRSGLHCSPLAHKTLSTFPAGTVRISLSPYHNDEDLDYLENSIRTIYGQ